LSGQFESVSASAITPVAERISRIDRLVQANWGFLAQLPRRHYFMQK
jgi:hypothetical protein